MAELEAAASKAGAAITPLANPHPEMTPERQISRAVELRPLLHAQQDEADARGCYSEEMHRAFVAAGFYRILQPRLFGGYEYDYTHYFRVIAEIARGHPGAGWCLALAGSHSAMIAAHWPTEAQVEFFGRDGHFVAPHSAPPGGRLTAVPGGYRVSGRWSYCSGVPYSTHALLNSLLVPDGKPAEVRVVVLPREKYTILDDWGGEAVLGMAASGSNTVVAEDVFVPAHHVVRGHAVWARPEEMADGTPGTRLHGNPMYLGCWMGPYHSSLLAPVVGAARAAIDELEELLCTKINVAAPNVPRAEHVEGQRPYGQAMAMTDAAEAILLQACAQYMDYCRRWAHDGTPVTVEENLRLWTMQQQAGALACSAVELVWRSAGTTQARHLTRIQRYFRDVSMYRQHISAQIENFAVYLARIHFGLPAGIFGV